MIEGRPFSISPVDVCVAQKVSIVQIALHFDDGRCFPISGFPRYLHGDDKKRKRFLLYLLETEQLKQLLDLAMRVQQGRPSRWRPANRKAHREAWNGPSALRSPRPTNSLSQYGSFDYVFGKTKILFNMSELDGGQVPLQPKKSLDLFNLPQRRSAKDHQNKLSTSESSGGRPANLVSVDEHVTMGSPQRIRNHIRDRSNPEPAKTRRRRHSVDQQAAPSAIPTGSRRHSTRSSSRYDERHVD
jgi:hypothetical protein